MDALRFDGPQDQIGRLQTILAALGFVIEQTEIGEHKAGESTIRAVRRFQRDNGLTSDEAWLLDQAAAGRLTQLAAARGLDPGAPSAGAVTFVVDGTVRDRDGVAMANLAVVAFDQELRDRQELGHAVTDGRGQYSIGYALDNLSRAAKGYADLIIEVR